MAETPLRSVRIPDEIWTPAQIRARERGESLSDVIRRDLAKYAATPTDAVQASRPE